VSVLVIVLIVLGALFVIFLVGGLLAARRRTVLAGDEYEQHVAAADHALEAARALDKGWDPSLLEAAARAALGRQRPGWTYDELALVLVDDRPGVEKDTAHYLATGGGLQARVILARSDAGWDAERVE
jgi:hypothetical protein